MGIDIQSELERNGEIEVVLESGEKYELHKYDTEFERGLVTTKGMHEGEFKHVTFPTSAVEHYSIHYES